MIISDVSGVWKNCPRFGRESQGSPGCLVKLTPSIPHVSHEDVTPSVSVFSISAE